MPVQSAFGIAMAHAQVKELGLWKPAGFPRPSDDFVALIEALPPPKAEALAWLEGANMQCVLLATHENSAVCGFDTRATGNVNSRTPKRLQESAIRWIMTAAANLRFVRTAAGGSRKPERHARATVTRGSRAVPDVQEYRVGVLNRVCGLLTCRIGLPAGCRSQSNGM